MQFLRRAIGLEENAAEVEGKLEAPAHVWCVVVQGDKLHAGCADGTLHTWTLGGAITRPLGTTTRAHEGTVYALCAWSLTLVSAGADGCVRLWHAGEEGTLQEAGVHLECGAEAESPRRPVLSLALSAAVPSELFAGGVDRCIRRWSRDSGGWRVSQVADNAHEKEVFALALCGAAGGAAGAAALLASAGGDGAVRLWRSNDLAPLASLGGTEPGRAVFALCACGGAERGSTTLLAGGHNGLRAYELRGGALDAAALEAARLAPLDCGSLRAHEAAISCVVALPRDSSSQHATQHAASADLRGHVLLWDVPRRAALRSWATHASGVYALAPLPQRASGGGMVAPLRLVSAASDGAVTMWAVTPPTPTLAPADAAIMPRGGGAPSAPLAVEAAAGAGAEAATQRCSWRACGENECVWAMLLLEADEGPRGPELACGGGSGLIQLWALTPDRTTPPRLRAQAAPTAPLLLPPPLHLPPVRPLHGRIYGYTYYDRCTATAQRCTPCSTWAAARGTACSSRVPPTARCGCGASLRCAASVCFWATPPPSSALLLHRRRRCPPPRLPRCRHPWCSSQGVPIARSEGGRRRAAAAAAVAATCGAVLSRRS